MGLPCVELPRRCPTVVMSESSSDETMLGCQQELVVLGDAALQRSPGRWPCADLITQPQSLFGCSSLWRRDAFVQCVNLFSICCTSETIKKMHGTNC